MNYGAVRVFLSFLIEFEFFRNIRMGRIFHSYSRPKFASAEPSENDPALFEYDPVVEEALLQYRMELGVDNILSDSSSSSEDDDSDLNEWIEISKQMEPITDSEVEEPASTSSSKKKSQATTSGVKRNLQASTSGFKKNLPSTSKKQIKPKAEPEKGEPTTSFCEKNSQAITSRNLRSKPKAKPATVQESSIRGSITTNTSCCVKPEKSAIRASRQSSAKRQCLLIIKKFDYVGSLKDAQILKNRKHSERVRESTSSLPSSNKQFTGICSISQCRRIIKNRKAFEKHQEAHRDDNRLYVCAVCTLRFFTFGHLKIHWTKAHKGKSKIS
jgi:hypothetical protein